MSHFRPTRSGNRRTAVALALGALALTAGCSANDAVTADPGEVASTVPASTPATDTTPVTPSAPATTAAPVTTTPTTRVSSPASADQVGNGDADTKAGPATAGGGVCGKLSAAEVGQAIGGKVAGSAMAGGGCQFNGANQSSTSATVIDRKYVASQGMSAAKDEATSAVEGTPEDLTGIGAEAFVVTGTMFGGEDVQGAGAVRVGPRLVSVTVNQESGLTAEQVRAKVIALLKLVASQVR